MHMPFRQIFPFIWGWFFTILRRFLPLFVVFDPSTTATSCQDAYFFPAMIYIHICICILFIPRCCFKSGQYFDQLQCVLRCNRFQRQGKKSNIVNVFCEETFRDFFMANSFLKLATLLNYQPINCFGSLMTRSWSSRTRKSRIQSGGPGKEKTQNKR